MEEYLSREFGFVVRGDFLMFCRLKEELGNAGLAYLAHKVRDASSLRKDALDPCQVVRHCRLIFLLYSNRVLLWKHELLANNNKCTFLKRIITLLSSMILAPKNNEAWRAYEGQENK